MREVEWNLEGLRHEVETREATGVVLPGDDTPISIGDPWSPFRLPNKDDPAVSRITVTADLPGLHCNLERVRIFVGNACVYECALHSVEGVFYNRAHS